MKFCPQCGATFEPDARFCQECGFDKSSMEIEESGISAELEETPKPSGFEPVCPKCAAPLVDDDRFCAECGFDKQTIIATKKPVVLPEADVLPPSEPEQPKETCTRCAAPLAAEERFCAECGFDKQASLVKETSVVLPVAEVFPQDEPEQPKETCPKCAAPLAAEARFCAECGFDKQAVVKMEIQPVVVPETIPETPVEPEIIPEPVPVPQPLYETTTDTTINQSGSSTPTQFCPNCGSKQSLDDIFCQDCGKNMTAEITAVATPEPKAKASIAEPEITPVPPVQKPLKKPKAIFTPAPQAYVTAVEPVQKSKNNKLILAVLLGLLGLSVLGAGGWFAYSKYFSNEKTELADTPVTPNNEVSLMQETTNDVTEEMLTEEVPAEEPELPKEPEKKQTQPKKTTPKKTEPQKQQAVQEEPVKKDDQITVVLKNTTTEKSPVTLFSAFNTNEVKGGPVFAQKVKFSKPTIVTRIITFHHNDGNGAVAGTISLEGKKKETGGPWQARNAYGSDGTVNGKWICEPNARMEAGTYKVVVSDEKSWSFNAQSGRKGFVIVEGYQTD